jgi:hypothetical protein
VKRLSLLAIAALAALALTAAIGSASASATVLCKQLINPCPSSEVLPAGTMLTYGTNAANLKNENITFSTTWNAFQCKYGLFGEQTTAQVGFESLPATGKRYLSECSAFFYPTCTMALSESSDQITPGGLDYFVLSGSTTLTANCSDKEGHSLTCEWKGTLKGTIHQTKEERYEFFTGSFKLTSAAGGMPEYYFSPEEECGKEATLKTVHLVPNGKIFVTS